MDKASSRNTRCCLHDYVNQIEQITRVFLPIPPPSLTHLRMWKAAAPATRRERRQTGFIVLCIYGRVIIESRERRLNGIASGRRRRRRRKLRQRWQARRQLDCAFPVSRPLGLPHTTSPTLPRILSCHRADAGLVVAWWSNQRRHIQVLRGDLLLALFARATARRGGADGWRGDLVEACPCRCVCLVRMSGWTCMRKS